MTEPHWQVVVRVPMRLPLEQHDELFAAVADAVAQWEPDERDGWDADVSGCREDETLEAAYESVVKALRRKADFQRVVVDGVGLLPGEHFDQFAERLVREIQSWRCGARRRTFPKVEAVSDALGTAAALARGSHDDEADHGDLMRSAALKLATLHDAAAALLAERDALRWLHAEAVFERDAERTSRQAWAAEATRLSWINEFNGASCLSDELHPRVCACISDDQAAQLGPGFSRPVCAVHSPGWPISTLTGMPCTHDADSRCVECVEESGVRVAPRGWQPGDPVYPDEREDSGGGACSDPECGVTWSPAGPIECPRCGSPTAVGTPWAEGGEPE